MARTLITGFGPFRNISENPSEWIARESGSPFEILEVSYKAVDEFVSLKAHSPWDNLLMLGVASERSSMSVELGAENLRTGADVLGVSFDGVIEAGGPAEIRSTLWTHELVELLKVEFPQELALSLNAGNYLCNYLYYQALRKMSIQRIGFLHVVMPEVLALSRQVEIVREIIAELPSLGLVLH